MRKSAKTRTPALLHRARALGALFLAFVFGLIGSSLAEAASAPNVLVVQVDDMARSQLRAQLKLNGRRVPTMPNLINGVANQGVELGSYYSSSPICGPSRATLLSGRATHNHRMLINGIPFGYPIWSSSEFYSENLPVWLQRAGYRTSHFGKFMNGYGQTSETEVPPGWSRWVTPLRDAGAGYYGSDLNIDGRVVSTGSNWKNRDQVDCRPVFYMQPNACLHATDLYTTFALKELGEAKRSGQPFYMQLDFNAPHDDGRFQPGPTPQARFQSLAGKVTTTPDLKDDPPDSNQPVFLREQPPLNRETKTAIRTRYRNEVLALRGVDQGIGRILKLLRQQKVLDNTYVIFTSDNGTFHGQHRIAYGKYMPHEPSSRQPLLVRGPGIPSGKRSASSGSNLDLAPTVLAMTGTPRERVLDGRSLLADLKSPRRTSVNPVLLEGFSGRDPSLPEEFLDGSGQKRPNQAMVLNYTGMVAGRWKYIRYAYGESELYDLARDPNERQNLYGSGKHEPIRAWSEGLIDQLETCSGPTCRPKTVSPETP